MTRVVSFRPTQEEERLLARIQRRHGFSTTAEALRHVLRIAAVEEPPKKDRLFGLRAPPEQRGTRSIRPQEIDEEVYGEGARDDEGPGTRSSRRSASTRSSARPEATSDRHDQALGPLPGPRR